MALQPEVRRALRAALVKLHDELGKKDEQDTTVFRVNPISNGYIVSYDDVEEFEIKVPVYELPSAIAPGALPPGGRKLGELPKMEAKKRWKLKRAEVFCVDAAAIKVAVDDALKLEEKVKNLIAEGVLSSDGPNYSEPGVGA